MRDNLSFPGAFLSPMVLRGVVRDALDEDLGRAGDITSAATIPEGRQATAKLVARKPGVIAGFNCVEETFYALDRKIAFNAKVKDGAKVAAKELLAEISGDARNILTGERVALNFLGHLSGVATLTAAYAEKIKHTKTKIVDTRKTTPGLRALEKYAVRCGGGVNHRMGLDDAVLIKDNHIAVAGGIAQVLKTARATVGHLVKIEIEVDTLKQFEEVLKAGGADVVMLDNMDPATMKRAVEMNAGKLVLEASGGVSLDTVALIAESGVDVISVGALTHSAPVLDIGLDIEI
jgi:nicotinate-nucleotide pyrophosphorylase (carboxylating)